MRSLSVPLRWRVGGLRNEGDGARIAAQSEKPESPKKQEQAPSDATGKLLTRPANGYVKVQIDSTAPSAGAKVQLSRRVDPSVPFVGGSWLVIAETEVTDVAGKIVTLKILVEKSDVKINGRKVDHYTPGVPIVLKASPTAR